MLNIFADGFYVILPHIPRIPGPKSAGLLIAWVTVGVDFDYGPAA